jgi:hypothetical protein
MGLAAGCIQCFFVEKVVVSLNMLKLFLSCKDLAVGFFVGLRVAIHYSVNSMKNRFIITVHFCQTNQQSSCTSVHKFE